MKTTQNVTISDLIANGYSFAYSLPICDVWNKGKKSIYYISDKKQIYYQI